jgi:CoA-transferase family III/Acyl-CoA dehydrogenase, middle domain/Acyl-CoA dehydrogenase, C-terminal domain/Acyl-CoA dehydrogenase, N-terminal domain
MASAVALRAIAESGAGLNGCVPVHMPLFGTASISAHGSEELKRRMLPGIASGERTICFAVIEPDAGSDTSQVRTRATKTATGWILDGQKVWITGALQAQNAVILARTRPSSSDRFDGLSLFLIDLGPAHVEMRPIPKLPHNAVQSVQMFIHDLPVPEDRLVGELHRGFSHLLTSLNNERVLLAAEMVGLGHAALRVATQYASEREVFGRKIGSNQAIAHPLARARATGCRLAHGPAGCPRDRSWPERRSDSQPGQISRRGSVLCRDRCSDADPRRHGHGSRIPDRALFSRRPSVPHRADQPGNEPQLHRPEVPRAAPVLLNIARNSPVTQFNRMLSGIRVVDFSLTLPGPFASQILGDMGASGLKIEPPGGDLVRRVPEVDGEAFYQALNAGKSVVQINLKEAPNCILVQRLVAQADVLIEGIRPGTMARYGLDFERVRAVNPGIVYCSLSG